MNRSIRKNNIAVVIKKNAVDIDEQEIFREQVRKWYDNKISYKELILSIPDDDEPILDKLFNYIKKHLHRKTFRSKNFA